MANNKRYFSIKRRAKGLIPLLQKVSDEQRIDELMIHTRTLANECRDIIACANGKCSVIARVCPNRIEAGDEQPTEGR